MIAVGLDWFGVMRSSQKPEPPPASEQHLNISLVKLNNNITVRSVLQTEWLSFVANEQTKATKFPALLSVNRYDRTWPSGSYDRNRLHSNGQLLVVTETTDRNRPIRIQ